MAVFLQAHFIFLFSDHWPFLEQQKGVASPGRIGFHMLHEEY